MSNWCCGPACYGGCEWDAGAVAAARWGLFVTVVGIGIVMATGDPFVGGLISGYGVVMIVSGNINPFGL